jgi:hypothetical protein
MYAIALLAPYCVTMILAKKISSTFTHLNLRKLFNWLFKPIYKIESTDFQKTQIARCDFWGGWLRIGCFHVSNYEFQNITIMIGIKRFHIDLELNFIVAPEREVRSDKKTHYNRLIEGNVNVENSFLGWEGIGIYKEKTLIESFGISKIEIGAHPLVSIGVCNFYHSSTQHAVLGCQIANFQVDLHAAVDSS